MLSYATLQSGHIASPDMMQANLFIGLGLLSTAYALKLGGWAALLGLAANAAFFATAGKHGTDALASAAVLVQTELAAHLPKQDTKQSQSAAAASAFHSLNEAHASHCGCTGPFSRSGLAAVKQLVFCCRSHADQVLGQPATASSPYLP